MMIKGYDVIPALVVVDVQNGFASSGGSYDQMGMDISSYRRVIPRISELIAMCRNAGIPIFYTQAVREKSGIDLLTKTHKILPNAREERIRKQPICVSGTWDAEIVDEIKPAREDHVVIKRRDSAFQDTEMAVWLRTCNVNTLIFCGIDTSISVESSLRDAFNTGYDVILISDATASADMQHFESTLEIVKQHYGFVLSMNELGSQIIASQC